jgi:tetratricopeptide (TPR) repeat protein
MAAKKLKDKNITVENAEVVEPIVEEKEVLQDFWATNGKKIVIAAASLLILVGGYFGYKKLIAEPKEMKAAEAIFPAEAIFDKMSATNFTKDSVNLALNGGTANGVAFKGLLKVISEFSGTASGNRANYLAGAAYMHNGEFEKSIKHLKDFDSNGAHQMEIEKNIMLGQDYAELKKTDEALNSFKKATTVNTKDNALTSNALYLAGKYAKKIGNNKEAIELFQKLKDNYPADNTVQGGEVDKYLATLGVTK